MRGWIKAIPLGIVLPTVFFVAATPPDAAASNTSKWMEKLGVSDLPFWLVAKSADHWIVAIIIIVALIYSVIVWRVYIARTAGKIANHLAPQASIQRNATFFIAEKRADIAPDWPIRDLFFHVNPDVLITKSQDEFGAVGDEILDKLSTGQLSCWGRQITGSHRAPLAKIDAQYWQYAKLVPWLLDDGEAGKVWQAGPRDIRSPFQHEYSDLQVNHGQALSIWPTQHSQVPLRDAAQRAYEAIEGTEVEAIICGLNRTPEQRISYFEWDMITHKVKHSGKKLPSSISKTIPDSVLQELEPVEGKNELSTTFDSEANHYVDVTVSRTDLARYLSGLKMRMGQ